jgi:hypothetical protein
MNRGSLSQRGFEDKHKWGVIPGASEKLLFRREVVWEYWRYEERTGRRGMRQFEEWRAIRCAAPRLP